MGSKQSLNIEKQLIVACGFIRRIEKSLATFLYDLFKTTPAPVVQIIISYYVARRYFDIAGEGCELADDQRTVIKTCDNGWCNSSYSSAISSLSNKCVKWDVLIQNQGWKPDNDNLNKKGSYISLGISSGVTVGMQFVHGKGYKYGYAGWCRKKLNRVHKWIVPYTDKFYGEGDIVSIELDLRNQKITFYVNYITQGIAYKSIQRGKDIEYRLAVSMYGKGAKIEIIDYTEK